MAVQATALDFRSLVRSGIGVPLGVLAALVAVFVGGKVQGSEESSQIGISFRDGIQRLPLKKV